MYRKTSGFTLIEIMVAMAIIAIALASLMKASGNHTHSAAYLKAKTLAHYVAMNEVTRLQLSNEWPDLGSSNKSTEMAGIEWYWTRQVEKTGDESGNIRGVKFTIYQDDKRTRNLAQVQAFIANPASGLNATGSSVSTGGSSGSGTQ
jgi:general secretion pathway protein I